MPKMVVFDADSMMLTMLLMTPKKTGKSTNRIVKSILTVAAAAAALTMIDSQTSSSIAAERVLPPPNIRDLFLPLAQTGRWHKLSMTSAGIFSELCPSVPMSFVNTAFQTCSLRSGKT